MRLGCDPGQDRDNLYIDGDILSKNKEFQFGATTTSLTHDTTTKFTFTETNVDDAKVQAGMFLVHESNVAINPSSPGTGFTSLEHTSSTLGKIETNFGTYDYTTWKHTSNDRFELQSVFASGATDFSFWRYLSGNKLQIQTSHAIDIIAEGGDITLLAPQTVKIAGDGNTDSYMLFASLDDDNPVFDIYTSKETNSIQLGYDGAHYYFGPSGSTDYLYLQYKITAETNTYFDLGPAAIFVLPVASPLVDQVGALAYDSGNDRLIVYNGSKWRYIDTNGDV
jgi:hypothetical protein